MRVNDPMADIHTLKQIVLNAIAGVEGYLGPPGMRSVPKDAGRALQSVGIRREQDGVRVYIRAVLQGDRDIPATVAAMTEAVASALRERAGVEARTVRVEVVKMARGRRRDAGEV